MPKLRAAPQKSMGKQGSFHGCDWPVVVRNKAQPRPRKLEGRCPPWYSEIGGLPSRRTTYLIAWTYFATTPEHPCRSSPGDFRTMQRMQITPVVRRDAFTTATAWVVLLFSAVASNAQEYLTLPIDDHAKTSRSGALAYLKGTAASKDKFEEYFTKYYFPSMTRTEPEALGNLGKIREDFFKQFMWKAANPAAQQELTNMALGTLGKIVTAKDPSCHPQVRYNAILFIGMLDEQPSDGRPPPKPLPKANQALTKIVDMATSDSSFPPAIILGAVVGLERHAIYRQSLSPDAVKAMTAALMKLVAHEEPIQEMNSSAYSWLRLRAASALTRMGTVGDKNSVHAAVIKLASTGKSIDDRCSAAAMLDRLDYKDVKLDDAGTAEPLFALARDVCADADKRATEFQDQQYSGSGGALSGQFANIGFEGYGGASNPANEIEIYPRRRTLTRIMDLRTAIKKVKPSLPAETQKKADAVINALNTAIASAADKGTTPLALVDTLRTMAGEIKQAVPAVETAEEKAAKEKETTNAF
jgi:hypothetical protein